MKETPFVRVISWAVFRPHGFFPLAQRARLEIEKYSFDYKYLDKLDHKKFRLQSNYGYHLGGTLFYSPVPNGQVIILTHGYGGIAREMELLAPFFLKLGYHVITYDLFAYGHKRCVISFGEREPKDLGLVVDWMKKRLGAQQRYGLYGHSLGANTVLHYVAESASGASFIIANAPFNKLDETIASHLQIWLKPIKDKFKVSQETIAYVKNEWQVDLAQNDMEAVVAQINVPVLYLHGDVDLMNPTIMSEQLLKSTPRGRRVVLKGANHLNTFTKTKDETEAAIKTFLEDVAGGHDNVNA